MTKAPAASRATTRRPSREPPGIPPTVEGIQRYLERQRRQARFRCVLSPETRAMSLWDMQMMLALLFLSIVTPYEVGFVEPACGGRQMLSPLFWLNRYFDLVFIADICINFMLMYQTQDIETGVKWVREPKQIAIHYLKFWFPIDFLSMLPSLVDFVNSECGGSGGPFYLLRVIRALRLVKLVRLIRVQRLIKRWQTRVSLSHSQSVVVKTMVKILFACHWFACLFRTQAAFAAAPSSTWMGTFGYCGTHLLDADELQAFDASTDEPPCISVGAMYAAAFYWSVMIITGSGGTDFYAAQFNASEQVLCTALVLAGALIWTDVLANFCEIATNADPLQIEHRQSLDDLNRFVRHRVLPGDLTVKLREFFHETHFVNESKAAVQVLEKMSADLRATTALFCFGRWFERIPYLRASVAGEGMLVKLSMNMEPLVQPPEEELASDVLYLISRGTVLSLAKALGAGDHFNVDFVLRNEFLRRPLSARAMTYLELFVVSRELLEAVLDEFPQQRMRVRKAICFLALRRGFQRVIQIKNAANAWPHSPDEEGGGGGDMQPKKQQRTDFESAMALLARAVSSRSEEFVGDAKISTLSHAQRQPALASNASPSAATSPSPPTPSASAKAGTTESDLQVYKWAVIEAIAESSAGRHASPPATGSAVGNAIASAAAAAPPRVEVDMPEWLQEADDQMAVPSPPQAPPPATPPAADGGAALAPLLTPHQQRVSRSVGDRYPGSKHDAGTGALVVARVASTTPDGGLVAQLFQQQQEQQQMALREADERHIEMMRGIDVLGSLVIEVRNRVSKQEEAVAQIGLLAEANREGVRSLANRLPALRSPLASPSIRPVGSFSARPSTLALDSTGSEVLASAAPTTPLQSMQERVARSVAEFRDLRSPRG